MVKAFDRVQIAYLELVMDCMNFPPEFRAWILMIHRGVTTRLIFKQGRMSEVIRLTVSERQGDPWAMIGYILQFEPFLLALDKVVTGVTLGMALPPMSPNPAAHTARGPGFADDYANITIQEQDVLAVDQLSKRYEEQSGALLSRNSKSKVIFLGDWKHPRRKPHLPVNYLKEVENGKVFGFIVKGTVKEIANAPWEVRVRKM